MSTLRLRSLATLFVEQQFTENLFEFLYLFEFPTNLSDPPRTYRVFTQLITIRIVTS